MGWAGLFFHRTTTPPELLQSSLGGGIPMVADDGAMLGDLPRSASKSDPTVPGSPFRGGGLMRENDLIGKNAVTAAAAVVQETRRRMEEDSVRAKKNFISPSPHFRGPIICDS